MLWAVVFCFGFSLQILAQQPNRIDIQGIALDTLQESLVGATVMLLSAKDSTLLNYTRTDENGKFIFKNVKNQAYTLKLTYLGFLPAQKNISISQIELVDLGKIICQPISNDLMEVVIKAAKAPLRIKGDTIEYDATTFKVPPGSTVEDLLRRLPGIDVDAQGNIKAQGRDVKRLYVDGKTFFADDPKSATKNLGAETISKVQVFNEKSEQANLTGIDDGKDDKVMNLELKDEFKKGTFGKVTIGAGTEDRWATRGNINKFDKISQFSVIAYANNINETGVNWDDYSEFKGQSAFGDRDNGDFGFNSGNRFYSFGGDFLNSFDGRGFTKNHGIGTNYNLDVKKVKFNANYFYNQTQLNLDQFSLRETFLSDASFKNTDTLARDEFRSNHQFNTRAEFKLDSNNLLIVKGNIRLSKREDVYKQNQFFTNSENGYANAFNLDNSNDQNTINYSSTAIFRRKFKKKGRSFAVSGGLNGNQSDEQESLFSLNEFFNATNFSEQVRLLNDRNVNFRELKTSLLYTEPISKKWFYEGFFNHSNNANSVNRQAENVLDSPIPVDSISVYFDNKINYNRFGSTLRYSYQGVNLAFGGALQRINLQGEYSRDKGEPVLAVPVNRNFDNLVYMADLSWEPANNYYLSLDYQYKVQQPSFNDLQPVPIINNPAFVTIGNPDLSPALSHSFGFDANHWGESSFGSMGFSSNYSFFDSQIIYSQNIDFIDSSRIRTISRPENLSGGTDLSFYLWSDIPIIKTKLSMNLGGDASFQSNPAFVNGVRNETNSNNYSMRLGFNLTPSNKLILGFNGNLRFNEINYSIQKEQNQDIINHSLGSSVKWQFMPKTFLESNFDYTLFKNDQFNFNRTIPIWNASVRRLLGKTNRIECRLAAFDLLNQRIFINQTASQNFVNRTIAPTLARYFMLSFTYNVRGFDDKLKKQSTMFFH